MLIIAGHFILQYRAMMRNRGFFRDIFSPTLYTLHYYVSILSDYPTNYGELDVWQKTSSSK